MRLIDAVRMAAGKSGGAEPAAAPAGSAFFEEGTITSVDGFNVCQVSIGSRSVTAKPVTDEPMKVNMRVFVSQSTEGWIIHGGKK